MSAGHVHALAVLSAIPNEHAVAAKVHVSKPVPHTLALAPHAAAVS